MQPHVAILMCTLNGAAYLPEQLASLLAQYHRNWSLWVSDDGSSDATWDILQEFQKQHGSAHDIHLFRGPRQGVAANYLSLLCRPDLPKGLAALCDQDDVWLPGKISRAVSKLGKAGPDTPIVYGARSFHTDRQLRLTGASSIWRRPVHFGNAMCQTLVSGHSMVLNASALDLVRQAGAQIDVPFHDWWICLLVTGAGGGLITDTRRVALYRQHGSSVLGSHSGLRSRVGRLAMVFGKTYADWLDRNIEALTQNQDLLTAEAAQSVDILNRQPAQIGTARARALSKAGLYRQSRAGTACLYMAAVLGRL